MALISFFVHFIIFRLLISFCTQLHPIEIISHSYSIGLRHGHDSDTCDNIKLFKIFKLPPLSTFPCQCCVRFSTLYIHYELSSLHIHFSTSVVMLFECPFLFQFTLIAVLHEYLRMQALSFYLIIH